MYLCIYIANTWCVIGTVKALGDDNMSMRGVSCLVTNGDSIQRAIGLLTITSILKKHCYSIKLNYFFPDPNSKWIIIHP